MTIIRRDVQARNSARKLLRDTPQYTPNRLINALEEHFDVTSDAKLAAILDIGDSTLSTVRHKSKAIDPMFILRVYDTTGWSIEHIRKLAGLEPILEMVLLNGSVK